jgi:glycosyltransferase involved in cell wall biosynthesis
MEQKKLSLIVPAFKQEKTIVRDVRRIDAALKKLGIPYEILVVVDGYLDKTMQKLKQLKNIDVTALGYETNAGKGFAVKYGVERAVGEVIGFIDAGMDLDPREIALMIDLMEWNKADMVIGSKLHPDSKVKYPMWRKIMSWGYRTLTHILFGYAVRDTQVGLKLFRRPVAKKVFKRIIVKRYAFDIEVLAVAQKLGYKKIIEAPVKLNFKKATGINTKNFWIAILSMFWETLAVFYRLKILHYYDKK